MILEDEIKDEKYYVNVKDGKVKVNDIKNIDEDDCKNFLFIPPEECDEITNKILEFMAKEKIGYNELLDVLDEINVDRFFTDADFKNMKTGKREKTRLKNFYNRNERYEI